MRPFRVVLVCDRCGQRRATVVHREPGKRPIGRCRECIKIVRGEISEQDGPPLRHSLAVPESGWMAGHINTPRPPR
jgi:hypothetical protein